MRASSIYIAHAISGNRIDFRTVRTRQYLRADVLDLHFTGRGSSTEQRDVMSF